VQQQGYVCVCVRNAGAQLHDGSSAVYCSLDGSSEVCDEAVESQEEMAATCLVAWRHAL